MLAVLTRSVQAEAGYTDLTGLDYSEPAIELARLVARSKGLMRAPAEDGADGDEEEDAPAVDLRLEVCDILAPGAADKYAAQFDLLCDKGTYDAISLHSPGAHLHAGAARTFSLPRTCQIRG